jgi:hypothetical protein
MYLIFVGDVKLVALQQTNQLVFGQFKELFSVGDQKEILEDELASGGFQFSAGVHVSKAVNTCTANECFK